MAASKSKAAPIGSSQWIQIEREQASQCVEQEVEEYSYSVRNELEWLNEHMAEIFSKSAVNFADVFKTPGKLRGKTPRTARKRDALAPRQPLGDIFAPNTQTAPSPAKTTAFYGKVAQFQIAEDAENQRPTSRSKSPQRVGKPGNTDSGYHTVDEMDLDAQHEREMQSTQETVSQKLPLRDDQPPPQRVNAGLDDTGRNSDESFASAKEDLTSRNASKEQLLQAEDSDDATVPDEDLAMHEAPREVQETQALVTVKEDAEPEVIEQDLDEETAHTPSDTSSPEKPLQRKSSFNFSSLPAREPFTAKRSIGVRESQFDANRNSVLGRSLGKSIGGAHPEEDNEYSQEKPEESKAHNKSSTQLLHERITMLGKAKEPRPSKSIPASALYPQLPASEGETAKAAATVLQAPVKDEMKALELADDDDDDWIAPIKPAQAHQKASTTQQPQVSQASPARPVPHQKSISTTAFPSPMRPGMHLRASSVSNPYLVHVDSTTPAGSPASKRHHDGPLSASKNKLWSALKSAKNIFASSASASAAAKLEAHNGSPGAHRSPKRDFSEESKSAAVFNMPGALYSEAQLPPSPSRAMSVVSASPSRKTRSSTESAKRKQKELKAQQKATDALEKERQKEAHKAAKQQEERLRAEQAAAARNEREQQKAAAQAERPASANSNASKEEMPPPPPPKSMLTAGKLRAPGRLVKPAREVPKSRPAPVSIRVASQSQRLGQASSSFASLQHESAAPAPPPKPSTGLRTASAQSNVQPSTAPNNARVKALEAAARKKEADEKAAQKKADQKRELERKRAEKAEQERRAEQERKAEEQRRLQETKLATQRQAEKQAAESKRREQLRIEQQRQQDAAQKARAAHELAEAIQRERLQQSQHPRGDFGGTLRQLAKNTLPAPAVNPAKPAKRALQQEEDEPQPPPPPLQRPGLQRGQPSYQQNEAKRRRTEEEGEQHEQRHSVMAPPKRPSNMRKDTLTKFPHGYTHAPPPAPHHASSMASNMFKQTVTAQHQLQHAQRPVPTHPSQTVQMSSARIPFAENMNPPAAAQHHAQQQQHHGVENAAPGGQAGQNKFKTPVRPAGAPKSAKSSPLYPNGDSIALPEIATDSEDEDEEEEDNTGGFRAPSWVASPALRDLLTQQQLVDPESVFGPIGELRMEEVFKGGKNAERMKRFRDRGSSAAWVESGDAVTSAEKRRDREGRERVVKDGGWRYGAGAGG